MTKGSLPRRLVLVLTALLLCWGGFVTALAWRAAAENEHEALQRLSYGLADHIATHWPELGGGGPEDPAARQALLRMLMTVNPGIQVYVLDAAGRVQNYIGEPGMVREHQIDTLVLARFLSGAPLPLYGTDPMGGGAARLFSVAALPSAARAAGYLYIVLDGAARSAVAERLSTKPLWRSVAWGAAAGLLAALLAGALAVRVLTRPLQELAQAMAQLDLHRPTDRPALPQSTGPVSGGDEVAAITHSFNTMALRLSVQHEQQQRHAAAHREVIANVAHDLRTPLTALHGHLEALRAGAVVASQDRQHVDTALVQSDKLRRLTQQLFELATLQSMEQVLHSERFRLDELVADAVQKFDLLAPAGRVTLVGQPPGPVELDGDLHLIERALTNLIDNAVRHSPDAQAVQVSMSCSGAEVAVEVADGGPGLPPGLQTRLNAGDSVRDPALRRHTGGGMGGLGLAIAQRIATLHGGRLHSLPSPQGGARLCLVLPRRPLEAQPLAS